MPNQRRSARLRNASEQLVQSSNGTPIKTLEILKERDDEPNATPLTGRKGDAPARPDATPHTPSRAHGLKPASHEMHPAMHHHSTLPRATDSKPIPAVPSQTIASSTPSKIATAPTFVFGAGATNATSNLSSAAQRLLDDLAGETARIRAELIAAAEADRARNGREQERKIAQPKGRSGRFSDVHKTHFKNMDSIANHASSFRAQPTQSTSSLASARGLKRTQSKANMGECEPAKNKVATANGSEQPKRSLTSEPSSSFKRVRKQLDDDVSTNRPVSRDATSIPRPVTAGKISSGLPRSSTIAHLSTPQKATLVRDGLHKTPRPNEQGTPTAIKTPGSGIPKSASSVHLGGHSASRSFRNGLDRVKSMWGRDRLPISPIKDSILDQSQVFTPSQTLSKLPFSVRVNKELPPLPLTSPLRSAIAPPRLATPVAKSVAFAQISPSPIKSALPRSKTMNSYGSVLSSATKAVHKGGEAKGVVYPTLPPSYIFGKDNSVRLNSLPPAVSTPTTFTFRSDSTINHTNDSPSQFGSAAGQASLRTVRPSIAPTGDMPGAFPLFSDSDLTEASKENTDPRNIFSAKKPMLGLPVNEHGLSSKKRRRFDDDDGDDADSQATERAAKKQKGGATAVHDNDIFKSARKVAIPKRIGTAAISPIRRSPLKPAAAAGLGTPQKSPAKTGGMSASRLEWLSRPKVRK